ncbi:MAG: hypothetical protein Q9181_007949 [Wetmoreana brouardii]
MYKGSVAKIMHVYVQQHGPNKINLTKFWKKFSVDVTHIMRTNSSGRRIPRIKTVQGLAMRDDGRNRAHPPIVPQFGAGAKEVQFFLEDAGEDASGKPKAPGGGKKGKKAPRAGPEAPSQGKYVSVYDHFRQSE